MSNVAATRRFTAFRIVCALAFLLVPTGVLGWGVEETHPRLAGRALRGADENGEITGFLIRELGLRQGLDDEATLRLGFDAELDQEIGPIDNSRLNSGQNVK